MRGGLQIILGYARPLVARADSGRVSDGLARQSRLSMISFARDH